MDRWVCSEIRMTQGERKMNDSILWEKPSRCLMGLPVPSAIAKALEQIHTLQHEPHQVVRNRVVRKFKHRRAYERLAFLVFLFGYKLFDLLYGGNRLRLHEKAPSSFDGGIVPPVVSECRLKTSGDVKILSVTRTIPRRIQHFKRSRAIGTRLRSGNMLTFRAHCCIIVSIV